MEKELNGRRKVDTFEGAIVAQKKSKNTRLIDIKTVNQSTK